MRNLNLLDIYRDNRPNQWKDRKLSNGKELGEGRLLPRQPPAATLPAPPIADKLPPPPPQPDRDTDGVDPLAPRHQRPGLGQPAEELARKRALSEVPGKVRYIHAGGPPSEAQLTHAQGSALFVEGEMLNLVWVNQDDIRRLGARFDTPENCPECGRPNERQSGILP